MSTFPIKKTITIELQGVNEDELVFSLDEVVRAIKNDFTSGFDRNESSCYRFDVTTEIMEG